jgi:translation elongation factor EF-1alpha
MGVTKIAVVINKLDGVDYSEKVFKDIQEGLKETVKAVAEELQVKPSIITKAIKIAHKDDWSKHEEEWQEIEGILDITKRLPEKD